MKFWQALTWMEPEQMLEVAQHAEALGFDGLMLGDHGVYPSDIQSSYPYSPTGRPPMSADAWYPDCWATIGALAAVTRRIRFSVGVYVLPLRNVFEVARATGTLAILSGGRFILGSGLGWMKEEFDIYGVEFRTRASRHDEMVVVLRKLWAGGMVEHHGRHFDFPALQISPAPPAQLPVYTGEVRRPRSSALRARGRLDRLRNSPDEVPVCLRTCARLRGEAGRSQLPFETVIGLNAARRRHVPAARRRRHGHRGELSFQVHRRRATRPLTRRSARWIDLPSRSFAVSAESRSLETSMSATPALSQLGLPPIAQIGHVVRDLRAAMARYEPMYGPFWTMDGSVAGATYRGRTADVKLEIAFGRSGNLEIELIEWQGGDSPHREFIERGGEGMHHVQFRVDDANGWIARLEAIGYRTIWYKRWCEDTVFAYLEREATRRSSNSSRCRRADRAPPQA
jgi:alkanesulfonate monooxygenase SsuD/methylene tetrahydromethanopterin reductase-like flavin-dependent oxidoreductase (luciferase family)